MPFFLIHLSIPNCDYYILNCGCFFQRIVFGDNGQVGHLVRKLAELETTLDLEERPKLNKMVEIVQDPEVTENLAIHNLVHLQPLQPQLLHFHQKVCTVGTSNVVPAEIVRGPPGDPPGTPRGPPQGGPRIFGLNHW